MQAPTQPLNYQQHSRMNNPESIPMLQHSGVADIDLSFETASKRFGGKWKCAFFLAALCVNAAAVVGTVETLIYELSPFDVINQVYLFVFGILMLVVDFPWEHPKVTILKLSVYKYLLFMTRFTGRGLWYVYLAGMIAGSLYDNNLCKPLGFILGGYVAAVGCFSTAQGFWTSIKLERVRKRVNERIHELATVVPPTGMTKEQFSAMARELVGSDSSFSEEDLNYILNALSSTVRADDVISRQEFADWARGNMTVL